MLTVLPEEEDSGDSGHTIHLGLGRRPHVQPCVGCSLSSETNLRSVESCSNCSRADWNIRIRVRLLGGRC